MTKWRAAPGEDALVGSDRETRRTRWRWLVKRKVAPLDGEMNIMMTRDHKKLSRRVFTETTEGHFLISLHTIRLFFFLQPVEVAPCRRFEGRHRFQVSHL